MLRILSLPQKMAAAAAALLLLTVAPLTLSAQDAPSDGGSPFKIGFSASLATETIDTVTYQSLGLIPDFGFGPLGVGIDFSFHFRFYEKAGGPFGFYPRAEDWYDKNLSGAQNFDKYLSRIVYVRWGKKGDPLYVQAGLLPGTTLGSGFLVGGYSNGALRPSLKYTGLELDADGSLIGFPFAGFESFIGNLSAFDVLGARAYLKPFALAGSDSELLKNLQVGLTVAADTNPYAQAPKGTSGSGSVAAYGVDALAPLFSSDLFSALASADLAMQGSHSGASLGVGGKLLGLFNWGLSNRFLGANFLPDYFDRGYEAARIAKYQIYKGAVTIPGTIGWQASLALAILGDQVTLGTQLSGPWSAQSNVYAQPQLVGYAQVKAGLLPVSLDAHYVKNGLTTWSELVSAEHALIGATVGYNLGAVTLSIVYDLRYLAQGETSPDGSHWISTSRVETSMKFF